MSLERFRLGRRARLLAALAIVVLVVFGVYSGVQASQRNGDRLDRALDLLEDAQADRDELRDLVVAGDKRLATLEAALIALGVNPAEVILPGDAEALAAGGDRARDAIAGIRQRVVEQREAARESRSGSGTTSGSGSGGGGGSGGGSGAEPAPSRSPGAGVTVDPPDVGGVPLPEASLSVPLPSVSLPPIGAPLTLSSAGAADGPLGGNPLVNLDPLTAGLLVGLVSPPLTAIVMQPRWAAQTRRLVSIVVALLLGALTAAASGGLSGGDLFTTCLTVLIAGQATYRTLWANVARSIESKTSPGAAAAVAEQPTLNALRTSDSGCIEQWNGTEWVVVYSPEPAGETVVNIAPGAVVVESVEAPAVVSPEVVVVEEPSQPDVEIVDLDTVPVDEVVPERVVAAAKAAAPRKAPAKRKPSKAPAKAGSKAVAKAPAKRAPAKRPAQAAGDGVVDPPPAKRARKAPAKRA